MIFGKPKQPIVIHQIQLGKPITHSYTWTKIAENDGNELYLCDQVFNPSAFGDTDEYEYSIVRDSCYELYESFSDEERNRLVGHPIIGDHVFLLSDVGYIRYSDVITPVKSRWWLRSPGRWHGFAAFVDIPDGLYYTRVSHTSIGLRPAIILKKGE